MGQYNPNKLKEKAKQKNILDVAHSLGMDLKRVGRNYQWTEHDSFVISPEKNYFSWFSRGAECRGADVIKMVEVVNNMTFKEALHYLLETETSLFEGSNIPKRSPFVYRVKEAKTFDYARKYLNERGLSDETIDFFLSKKIMVQAIHTDYQTGKTEPIIVFKHYDMNGEIIGGARQGIWYNPKLYPDTGGRLKRTLPNIDYCSGVIVDIGERVDFKLSTPENPFKIYAFEAPIDMMSYYELHKNKLNNCRLVSMNGLNKGVISRAIVEALVSDSNQLKKVAEEVSLHKWLDTLDALNVKANRSNEQLKIILAVDNDESKFNPKSGKVETPGKDFYMNFGLKDIQVIPHMPKIHDGQTKNDWNDELKYQKEMQKQKELFMQKIIDKAQSTVLDTDIEKGG